MNKAPKVYSPKTSTTKQKELRNVYRQHNDHLTLFNWLKNIHLMDELMDQRIYSSMEDNFLIN